MSKEIIIYDEASNIPEELWEKAEQSYLKELELK